MGEEEEEECGEECIRENSKFFVKMIFIGIGKLRGEEGESWLLDGFLVARHFSKSLVQFIRNGFELFFFVNQLIHVAPLNSLDVLNILEGSLHVLLQHLVTFLFSTQFVFESVHFLLQFLHGSFSKFSTGLSLLVFGSEVPDLFRICFLLL